jgi:hypothetical protein
MLLSTVRVARPELRDSVLELVQHLQNAPESALFPVVALVRLLGIQVAPDFQTQLTERGEIHFTQDQFRNSGELIKRRVRLGGVEMNLEVAAELCGVLHRADNTIRLTFDKGHSVKLSKLVLKARLHSLAVHSDHIDVDLRGGGGLRIDLV